MDGDVGEAPTLQAVKPTAFQSLVAVLTKTHAVPKRFGVTGILAVTTGIAILFAILRLLKVTPAGFFFVGLMALAICAAQIFWNRVPRAASAVVGGICL
ncbi:MAG: hypothetical protein WEH44_07115, partial [Pirellulaceae bacterium]